MEELKLKFYDVDIDGLPTEEYSKWLVQYRNGEYDICESHLSVGKMKFNGILTVKKYAKLS